MTRQYVDAGRGSATFLPLCECGWRGDPVTLRSRAWAQARTHALRVHADTAQADRALRAAQTREAAR